MSQQGQSSPSSSQSGLPKPSPIQSLKFIDEVQPAPYQSLFHFIPVATSNVRAVNPGEVPKRLALALNWGDFLFRYDPAAQILRLFFVKTPKETVLTQQKLIDGVTAFKDDKGKFRYLEFAQSRLVPHFYATTDIIDNKPPLTVACAYEDEADVLYLYLVPNSWIASVGAAGQSWNEQDETEIFTFDVDGKKLVMGFNILEASTVIAQ